MSILKSLKTLTLSLLVGTSLISGYAVAQQAPAKPKVLIFDVNETLLDLTSMRTSIGKALGRVDLS
ncbi:hypothetical protein [Pseudoalteromonas aliena]|uniref:hypothetical protein n=1 Tax=Pseudoalteromonas aliena TaxID=247523 RepID=UPI003CD0C89F